MFITEAPVYVFSVWVNGIQMAWKLTQSEK